MPMFPSANKIFQYYSELCADKTHDNQEKTCFVFHEGLATGFSFKMNMKELAYQGL